MPSVFRRIASVLVPIVIGLPVALFAFVMLMPYIEASRSEARMSVAYRRVCELAEDASGPSSIGDANNSTSRAFRVLEEVDPWGTPYRVSRVGDEGVRVASAGRDMAFASRVEDSDDIYSDMPASPLEPIYAQKKWQMIRALGVAVATWIGVAMVCARIWRPLPAG